MKALSPQELTSRNSWCVFFPTYLCKRMQNIYICILLFMKSDHVIYFGNSLFTNSNKLCTSLYHSTEIYCILFRGYMVLFHCMDVHCFIFPATDEHRAFQCYANMYEATIYILILILLCIRVSVSIRFLRWEGIVELNCKGCQLPLVKTLYR